MLGGDEGTEAVVVDVFAAGGEVGDDLAAVDWAAGPLGPPDGWPQSLRTAVSILLSSRFPMWLAWGPDLTFFCNAAYRRDTLGRKYPWALGRSAREVWAEIWDDIGPRVDSVLATGEATWDEALMLLLGRSGFPEETYHTFSYSPLRDDAGAVVGMLCVVSEDTERVIGERRMATLHDLGSDPDVTRGEAEVLARACGRLAGNPRDLPFTLAYLFEDGDGARLAGSTGLGAVPPVGSWPVDDLARGESALVELTDAWPRGPWAEPPVQALAVPLRQLGGAPFGFLVAGLNRYRPLDEAYRGFVDLVAGHLAAGIAGARGYHAQQRRAEELAELDRAKTTFFANVSHEFRTPLTLIMGPVAELRDRLARTDPGVREDLDLIHRNGLRLGKLVNTLLDFSRIEAGRVRARYEPVDLAAVTAELASVFRSAVDKAGLAFEVDCPPLPEPVRLDRGMWEKVVLNLLSNALKFTFDGAIGVAVRADGDAAVVTVSDTGVGIPEREVSRLFERFHRVENTRSRSNEGSGIGLALVRELVGLHGGAITAESAEGEGTRFTIRLPFGDAHLPADALVDPGDVPGDPGAAADPYLREALRWLPDEQAVPGPIWSEHASAPEPATVLVADDNADMREYLVRLLAGAGYETRTAVDGERALAAIRATPPDLVVSDVMMPGLDGLTLVAALRGDPRTAAVPVLLLSARAGQEASIEGLRAGADDYLVKPFAAAELLARARVNVQMARLRGHHARWRTALVESLQEAFFVCDQDGAVVEVNAAFTDILGFGPEGLPYPPRHPWWPAAELDPVGFEQVNEVFDCLLKGKPGSHHAVPVVHRDGHRLWISVTFNQARDPDTGLGVTVGTFRDVTTEHHAVQRDNALAALGLRLSEATSLSQALAGALDLLRGLFGARRVHAVVRADDPAFTSTDPDVVWDRLPTARRERLLALCDQPALVPVSDGVTSATIPLDHPEGPMALWVDLDELRPFTDQDRLLLSLLAGRLSQGLGRAYQIDQQRETAIALQRAILGPDLPTGFAVRYEPAARPLEVGGDWYDTAPMPDGRIGIVVGDCVGRGLEAAAVMGQLRSACRALLLQDAGPARTLMALDDFAAGLPGAICTTVFCGVLDPETGVLTYSSAGHPPAVLATPDGTTRLLDEAQATPLAVLPGSARPEARCPLPVRSTLLMYTDGLVERRGVPLTDGMDVAGVAVREGSELPLEKLATHVMTRLSPAAGYDDDVAVLLCRHPGPLKLSFPADPARLGALRADLRAWLDRCGVGAETVEDVLLAVGEACANAIEHGYRDTDPGTVAFCAEAAVTDLHLTITDSGRWHEQDPDRDPHRGRGLALMRALAREVTVTSDHTGTTVHLRMSGTRAS
ncbi:SpoIIE family protein phosphatase [Actinokineospora auranticolor]|uniref:histidine kinase n=1 Tax=Actinokineospora auranticolor TaxID=155976 RepID=A0A2S6GTI8_9PSEU|nr:SpoIIE family protein phosphatase [Actinokineospora auranticolor]PPK68568.1 PAS domain S-box-containing protein [Actinokineospora auranticolor]